MRQRVLVCGGRNYSDREKVNDILDVAHAANPIELLIHGGADGADSLAKLWARSSGIPNRAYHADWHEGLSAGPRRNQRMLDEAKPHLVIAFPGGIGTANMVKLARRANVPVVIVRPTP